MEINPVFKEEKPQKTKNPDCLQSILICLLF